MCFSILDDLFDLQYDLQDDLGGLSHKSKMILELLVEHFVSLYLRIFSHSVTHSVTLVRIGDFKIQGHLGGHIGGQIGHPKLKSTYLFIRLSYMHKV